MLILAFLFSCASEDILRTWMTSYDYEKSFDNILIMGLINNVNLRSSIENEFVYAARLERISTGNGMSLFPPELGKPFEDVENAKTRMRGKGYDGVLTVTLVNINETRYIEPEVVYEPFLFYERFGNYYRNTYQMVYRPGYFSVNSKYFLEVNFYELKKGQLVWTGRSRDFDYSEFDEFLPEFSKLLFKNLIKSEVLKNDQLR
ncbi:hypothetical protein HZR84_12150 [Hyphobacterium sp. CCMP332]|nr:hypothetical protein HZR84_12150 [Hyphobacterium sp. CCMP332]